MMSFAYKTLLRSQKIKYLLVLGGLALLFVSLLSVLANSRNVNNKVENIASSINAIQNNANSVNSNIYRLQTSFCSNPLPQLCRAETEFVNNEWPCMATGSCRFAYVFYVTRPEYMCASLINAFQLRNFAIPTISIVIIHISTLSIIPEYRQQASRLNVTLRAVPPMPSHKGDYEGVMVKLRIWQLTEFDRIIYLDADMLVLRSLDHLFLLPRVELAVPRAYWQLQPSLTSILLVLIPNEETFNRLVDKYMPGGQVINNVYDMDLINNEYIHKALLLHDVYAALDSHMRENDTKYWPDLDVLYHKQALLLHFSGIKPWLHGPTLQAIQKAAPDAHPSWYEFRLRWWGLVSQVCPWKVEK